MCLRSTIVQQVPERPRVEFRSVQICNLDAKTVECLFGEILPAEADQRHAEAIPIEAGDHPAKQALYAVHPRALPAQMVADLENVQYSAAHRKDRGWGVEPATDA